MPGSADPTVTESAISALATQQSYSRGESYYQDGRVRDVIRRGDVMSAAVQGSQYDPYRVSITLTETGIGETSCSCPYDYGGICKHRVAVLLRAVREPDSIPERPPVDEVIANATPEQVEATLLAILERHPELEPVVEGRLDPIATEEAEGTDPVDVDTEAIRRQVNLALPGGGGRPPSDGYAEAQRAAEELGEILEDAWRAIEAGDGAVALTILEAIGEEVATGDWMHLVPYDAMPMFSFLGDLDAALAEALLTAELDADERERWAERIFDWSGSLEHFTGDAELQSGAAAAQRGWDVDRIRRAMRGESPGGEIVEGDSLIKARLNVLERADRVEEYLNLSAAAGQHLAHARMLLLSGEVTDAVEYGTERFRTPGEFLSLAQVLEEADHSGEALSVGAAGLDTEGLGREQLAGWLRDRAAAQGEESLALEGAIAAYDADPSLSAYLAVEELADEEWSQIRDRLLETLRERKDEYRSRDAAVEVFLHEDLFEEAIDVAEASGHYSTVEPVVDAVTETHPDWTRTACREQAMPIIENGDHDRYRHAVRWLKKEGHAAHAAGELVDWRADMEDILDEHSRRRKLVPMLEEAVQEVADEAGSTEE